MYLGDFGGMIENLNQFKSQFFIKNILGKGLLQDETIIRSLSTRKRGNSTGKRVSALLIFYAPVNADIILPVLL